MVELTLESQDSIYLKLSKIQDKIALFPDYSFKDTEETQKENKELTETVPAINAETSISGILGGFVTLLLAMLTGVIVRIFKRKKERVKIT